MSTWTVPQQTQHANRLPDVSRDHSFQWHVWASVHPGGRAAAQTFAGSTLGTLWNGRWLNQDRWPVGPDTCTELQVVGGSINADASSYPRYTASVEIAGPVDVRHTRPFGLALFIEWRNSRATIRTGTGWDYNSATQNDSDDQRVVDSAAWIPPLVVTSTSWNALRGTWTLQAEDFTCFYRRAVFPTADWRADQTYRFGQQGFIVARELAKASAGTLAQFAQGADTTRFMRGTSSNGPFNGKYQMGSDAWDAFEKIADQCGGEVSLSNWGGGYDTDPTDAPTWWWYPNKGPQPVGANNYASTSGTHVILGSTMPDPAAGDIQYDLQGTQSGSLTDYTSIWRQVPNQTYVSSTVSSDDTDDKTRYGGAWISSATDLRSSAYNGIISWTEAKERPKPTSDDFTTADLEAAAAEWLQRWGRRWNVESMLAVPDGGIRPGMRARFTGLDGRARRGVVQRVAWDLIGEAMSVALRSNDEADGGTP